MGNGEWGIGDEEAVPLPLEKGARRSRMISLSVSERGQGVRPTP